MAAATSYEHFQKQHLPPSPPPSPPSTRRRAKKKVDPFEELAAATPLPSQPSSPAHEEHGQESVITRIILTPLFVTSFIISLFFVNRRNRVRRTEEHSPNSSILRYLAPSRWLDPEPYQDPDDSTWGYRGSAGHVEPNDAIGPRNGEIGKRKRRSWHLNRKIRKVAKLEVGDALEMRGQIMVVMMALFLVCSVVLFLVLKWFVGTVSSMFVSAKA